MELTAEEQTLLATFRRLDVYGRKELLRHASRQYKLEQAASVGFALSSGPCNCKPRQQTASEPIFTE